MENSAPKRQNADLKVGISLPGTDKLFYDKLTTEKNLLIQIKKASTKIDTNQSINLKVNEKEISLSKEEISNENLKELLYTKLNTSNPNLKNNMEKQEHTPGVNDPDKNLKFLKDQIKFLGFGESEKLHKELIDKFMSNDKDFSIKTKSDKATFNKAEFILNFKRSETTGKVFFNSFDTNLKNEKRDTDITQNFSTSKEKFTAQQSINLLEGRSVKTQIEKEGVKKDVFVELKLKEDKNEYGNYQKNYYHEGYGVSAEKAVAKEKFIFQDDKHKDITLKSLEKGNVVNAKFHHPQTDEVMSGKAVLNVQYKSVMLYDSDMKRVNSNEKSFVKDPGETEENSTRKQESQSRKM